MFGKRENLMFLFIRAPFEKSCSSAPGHPQFLNTPSRPRISQHEVKMNERSLSQYEKCHYCILLSITKSLAGVRTNNFLSPFIAAIKQGSLHIIANGA